MTTLVTGGCGLVGSYAVYELRRRGEECIAVDLKRSSELFGGPDFCEVLQRDLTDVGVLDGILQAYRVDRIIHTASLLTPASYNNPAYAYRTNLLSTLNVLESARQADVRRVVVCSTGKVVPTITTYSGCLQEGRLDVEADPYTTTKVTLELVANDYRRLYGLDTVIVRFRQAYGPGSTFSGNIGQILQFLVGRALAGAPTDVARELSNGLAQHPSVANLVHAHDAARGVVAAALRPGLESTVFEIGGPRTYTVREIVETVARLIPGAQLQAPPSELAGRAEPPDPRAEAQLGYRPAYGLEDGLADYLSWLQDRRRWRAALEERRPASAETLGEQTRMPFPAS